LQLLKLSQRMHDQLRHSCFQILTTMNYSLFKNIKLNEVEVKSQLTPIYHAVRYNDMYILGQIYNDLSRLSAFHDTDYKKLICYSTKFGHVDCIQFFLKRMSEEMVVKKEENNMYVLRSPEKISFGQKGQETTALELAHRFHDTKHEDFDVLQLMLGKQPKLKKPKKRVSLC